MEGLPGRGAIWAKREAFYQKLSRWLSLGLPCLKNRELEISEEPKTCGWRPDVTDTNVPLFVAQRRFFPPVPASLSLDVCVGLGPAQWIQVFGDRTD